MEPVAGGEARGDDEAWLQEWADERGIGIEQARAGFEALARTLKPIYARLRGEPVPGVPTPIKGQTAGEPFVRSEPKPAGRRRGYRKSAG